MHFNHNLRIIIAIDINMEFVIVIINIVINSFSSISSFDFHLNHQSRSC
jgi:hypothetical protein